MVSFYIVEDLVIEARESLEEANRQLEAARRCHFWQYKKKRNHLDNADLLQDEAEDIINEIQALKRVYYGA